MRVMSRRMALVAAGVAVSAVVGVVAAGTAVAATTGEVPTPDNGGSIVEDYSYPGAAGILSTYHVKLVSGDGHILFAPDCGKPRPSGVGRVSVRTSESADAICFDVLGPTGLLNLEVPAVYEVDARYALTAGHKGTVDVVPDGGTRTTVPLDPNYATQVGIGTGSNSKPTTLLQIAITTA